MRLCMICKDIQKTCCQGNLKINLTLGDVRRITAASGRNDFFELKPALHLSANDKEDYDYDPNWLRYITLPGSYYRLLKIGSNGNCVFLGDQGCVLNEDTRPLICRLYPYTYNETGMIGLVLTKHLWCPIHVVKEGENLTHMLEMSREQADLWRRMLYEELREDYEKREKSESLFS
jgi:Fe-S-cluster containining protein